MFISYNFSVSPAVLVLHMHDLTCPDKQWLSALESVLVASLILYVISQYAANLSGPSHPRLIFMVHTESELSTAVGQNH